MEEITALGDVQLIEMLKSNGLGVGPITSTTRRLYQKRLFKALHPEETDGSNDSSTPKAADNFEGFKVKTSDSNHGSSENSSHNCDQQTSKPLATSFFGVQVPAETDIANADAGNYVFDKKQDALKFIKLHPGSRFKVFPTRETAGDFVRQGVLNFQSPKSNGQLKVAPGSPAVSESGPFKTPRPQELVMFRKAIEVNDLEKVSSLVWTNPRYLVSSVDTPSVLQEGFHYNALHVSANKNKPEVCRFILDTLECPEFLKLLFPDDNLETRLSRMNFVVDLYLNTPDSNKGNSETPLHFACKFGNVDVVEVLTSHPKTDRNRRNKYGETASDVVCCRAHNPTHQLKDQICDLLEDRYYVPLLRPADNSSLAKVAIPWSPSVEKDRPLAEPQLETQLSQTPMESPYSVKAYAGPMSPSQAEKFRRRWLTPPSPSMSDRQKYAEVKLSDNDKGYERIGRHLAKDMRVPWSEYWPFLDEFTDLTSADGLKKLELYLERQTQDKTTLQRLDKDLQSVESQLRHLQLDRGQNSLPEEVYRQRPEQPSPKNSYLPEEVTKSDGHETENMETECPATPTSETSSRDSANQFCDMDIGNLGPVRVPPHSTAPFDLGNSPPRLLPSMFTIPQERRQSAEQSDSSFSSVESYETAVEDLDMEDVNEKYSECHTPKRDTPSSRVFILGEEPTKADVDVLRAVENSPITPDTFPHVHGWKNMLLSYSEQTRTSWKSPVRGRGAQSTPRRTLPTHSNMMSDLSGVDSPASGPKSSNLSYSLEGQSSIQSSLRDNDTCHNVRTNLMDSFQ